MTTEYELIHHGILGMKWGVRRYQAYGEGGYNPKHKGKNQVSKKQQRYEARKAKARSDRERISKDRDILSDKAIDQTIKRLQKEKQLKDLTDEVLHPGKVFAKKMLKGALGTAATGAAAYGGYLLLQKAMGTKVKWKYVPRKAKLKSVKGGLALIDKAPRKVPAGLKIGKVAMDSPKHVAGIIMKGGFKKK